MLDYSFLGIRETMEIFQSLSLGVNYSGVLLLKAAKS